MPRSGRRALAVVAAGVLLVMLGGCSSGPAASATGGVAVTLSDYRVALGSTALPGGSTHFNVTNLGPSTHELEVLAVPAGVDADNLPVVNGVADPGAKGLVTIDEVEDIAPSTSAGLTVSLAPGTYVLICNVAAHYSLGMHTVITVR